MAVATIVTLRAAVAKHTSRRFSWILPRVGQPEPLAMAAYYVKLTFAFSFLWSLDVAEAAGVVNFGPAVNTAETLLDYRASKLCLEYAVPVVPSTCQAPLTEERATAACVQPHMFTMEWPQWYREENLHNQIALCQAFLLAGLCGRPEPRGRPGPRMASAFSRGQRLQWAFVCRGRCYVEAPSDCSCFAEFLR